MASNYNPASLKTKKINHRQYQVAWQKLTAEIDFPILRHKRRQHTIEIAKTISVNAKTETQTAPSS